MPPKRERESVTLAAPKAKQPDPFDITLVLHAEEVSRSRAFYFAMAVILTLTAAFLPVLPGPGWLRVSAAIFSVTVAGMCVFALLIARHRKHYGPAVSVPVGMAGILLGMAVLYYVGVFSAGAMVLALAIYFFGTSHNRFAAVSVYTTAAICYLIASTAVATGLVPDWSLFGSRTDDGAAAGFQLIMSQVNFLLIFLMARSSRRATERAIERTRKASIQIRKREALLNEARSELAHIRTDEGRYTGSSLAGYSIGKLLGRGAMGEVYAAQKRGGSFALKLLHPNLVEDAEVVERFMREAQAASAINDIHVPKIHEAGWIEDSVPYLVMDLLEGHDLGWHLRRGNRLDLPHVLDLCDQVAAGLAAARAAGIVHRDLKPGNLLRTESMPPTWIILDFGLSKFLRRESSLTNNAILGTPMYMAPEQIIGPAVDHQTDVFALSAIAYRALTGSPAFDGADVRDLLAAVLQRQPANPCELVGVPQEVALVMALGLAKERDLRLGTAEELAASLRAASRGEMDSALRARAEAILSVAPWGTTRQSTVPPGYEWLFDGPEASQG